MSRTALQPFRKLQKLMMNRWRPSDAATERRHHARLTQLAMMEGLENRNLFAVTPLPEVHGPVVTTQTVTAGTLNTRLAPDTITDLSTNYGLTTSDGWRAVGDTTLSVAQFDDLGGTRVLVSVDVSYSATMVQDFNFDITNLDPLVGEDIQGSGSGSFTLTPDVGTALAGSVAVTIPFTPIGKAGEANDSVLLQEHDIDDDTQSFSVTDPGDLAAYIGAGNLNYALSATGSGSFTFNRSSFDDATTFVTTITRAEVTVTYNYLVYGSIEGTKFEDTVGEGDTGDFIPWTGPAVTINLYADDGDGVFDAGDTLEDTDVTDANGDYSFDNLLPGVYHVEEVVPTGYTQTYPTPTVHTVTVDNVDGGDNETGLDFANFIAEVGIDLTKYANGEDTDCVDVQIGDQVHYTYTVVNTGNTALDITSFIDDNATAGTGDDFTPTYVSGDTDSDGLVDTDETWHFEAYVTAIAGEHENTAVIEANGVIGDANTIVGNDSDSDKACYETPEPGGEGLTPGYWKRNATFNSKKTGLHPSWNAAGYSPSQKLNTIFTFPASLSSLGNLTMLQALEQGGGGYAALFRHATAAILNAAHPEVDYAYSVAQITTMVNSLLASNPTKTQINTLKDLFAVENEKGANLNQHGQAT